jgi:hypothetical protein
VLFQAPHGDKDVQDEYSITEGIKKRLAQTRTEKEVYIFSDLHRKLQTRVGNKTEHSLLNFIIIRKLVLTLREEYRLKMFKKRVLRRIFGRRKWQDNGVDCLM